MHVLVLLCSAEEVGRFSELDGCLERLEAAFKEPPSSLSGVHDLHDFMGQLLSILPSSVRESIGRSSMEFSQGYSAPQVRAMVSTIQGLHEIRQYYFSGVVRSPLVSAVYLTSITLSGRRQLEWPVGDGFSLGWGFRFYFSFFRAA